MLPAGEVARASLELSGRTPTNEKGTSCGEITASQRLQLELLSIGNKTDRRRVSPHPVFGVDPDQAGEQTHFLLPQHHTELVYCLMYHPLPLFTHAFSFWCSLHHDQPSSNSKGKVALLTIAGTDISPLDIKKLTAAHGLKELQLTGAAELPPSRCQRATSMRL